MCVCVCVCEDITCTDIPKKQPATTKRYINSQLPTRLRLVPSNVVGIHANTLTNVKEENLSMFMCST